VYVAILALLLAIAVAYCLDWVSFNGAAGSLRLFGFLFLGKQF
jgi:hypothetical protein